jgi:hypothetical protein
VSRFFVDLDDEAQVRPGEVDLETPGRDIKRDPLVDPRRRDVVLVSLINLNSTGRRHGPDLGR